MYKCIIFTTTERMIVLQKKKLEEFLLQHGGTYKTSNVYGGLLFTNSLSIELFPLKVSFGYKEEDSSNEHFAIVYPQKLYILGNRFYVMNEEDAWTYLYSCIKLNEKYGKGQ